MKLKWITMVISLALAGCGPAAATSLPTPDAPATALRQQIIATATALRLTAEAGERVAVTPPPPPDAIQLSVAPAQSLGGADFQVSGPFTISASAPNIVRVEFYTRPSDQTAVPTLEFTDDEGNDGWNWTWQTPPAGWFGQVWVIAYYADESSTSSQLFITVAP